MNERLTAIVGARITEFRKKMAEVKKIAKTIPNKIVVNVEAKVDKFQKDISRVANTIQSLSAVIGNALGGTALMVSPALVPIIATLAGGLGAVVSGFGFAAIAAVAFTAVAIPGIMKLFDETTKLTGAQKKAKGEFDKFKSTWQGIAKALEKPVLQAFTTAMQIANQTLKMARPLFDSAATAVNNLLNSLKQSLGTPPVKAFFDYMNKNAGPMLETLGKSVGNFMQGFMSMMVAFGPLAEDMAQGLLKMSTRFAEWAANLQNNQSFQNFLTYVRENAPGVINLIGNLTTFLINLGIGMAPLGTAILNMVNQFLSWSNAMMQAHPLIGQIVGVLVVLAGGFMALTPVIIAARVLFMGFGTSITSMIGKVLPVFTAFKTNMIIGLKLMGQNFLKFGATVATGTTKVISSLGKVITKVAVASAKFIATIVKMGARYAWLGAQALIHAARIAASWLIAMGPVGWVIATVIALVILIIANWDKVKSATIKIFGAVWNWLKSTWDKIKNVFKVGATESARILSDKFNEMLNFVIGLGTSFYNAGKGLIEQIVKGIKATVGKVTSAISSVAEKARNFLPFSPAKVGPLSDLDKLDFGGPMVDSIMRAKNGVTSAMADLLQTQRTQLTFDAGLSNSDFGRIRHEVGAEVSNFEKPDPTINVYNEWDGEKVVSYVERGNAKRQRITDGFGGK